MDHINSAGITPSRPKHHLARHLTDSFLSKTRYWWLLLIAGAAWIMIAVVMLRFTYTTVEAIAKLFGAVFLLAAAAEVMVGALSSRGWRVARWLVAVVFVVAGVAAFFAVKATVVALAAVMSVLFIAWGIPGRRPASSPSRERGWGAPLIAAVSELAIGLWIATSRRASITVLFISVARTAMVHGLPVIRSALL